MAVILRQDSSLDVVLVRTSVGQTYRCRRIIIATSPQQARM